MSDTANPGNQSFGQSMYVEVKRDKLARLESDRARSINRGKMLIRVRDVLVNIKADIEDEVDRTYFGSMNQADMFREVVEELDAFKWDRIMQEGPEPDVIEECRKANGRADTAEARLKRIITQCRNETRGAEEDVERDSVLATIIAIAEGEAA